MANYRHPRLKKVVEVTGRLIKDMPTAVHRFYERAVRIDPTWRELGLIDRRQAWQISDLASQLRRQADGVRSSYGKLLSKVADNNVRGGIEALSLFAVCLLSTSRVLKQLHQAISEARDAQMSSLDTIGVAVSTGGLSQSTQYAPRGRRSKQ
jgi:hypothetical protein